MSDLRERLIEALWTGTIANGGRAEPREGLATERADAALVVVAAWLRDEAHALTIKGMQFPGLRSGLLDEAAVIDRLAASLTRPDHTEEKRDG